LGVIPETYTGFPKTRSTGPPGPSPGLTIAGTLGHVEKRTRVNFGVRGNVDDSKNAGPIGERTSSAPPIGRRTFVDRLLATSAVAWLGTIVYPVVRYLKPPADEGEIVTSVTVGAVDEFHPDSGKIFKFGRKPGLLVRAADGGFKAFEATCTHLDCVVQYRGDLGLIWCACHNGRYDLNGTNIAGPPPRPLPELRVDVKDGKVFVSRMA